jgi:hypothetical protein
MHDRFGLHAGDQVPHRGRVADVAGERAGPRLPVRHDRLAARVGERARRGRAEEPRSARHQHAHGPTPQYLMTPKRRNASWMRSA